MTNNNKKGFTLIELLVVIAIIGILSAIGLVSLNGAREKARDAKRQSDLASIKSALALVYDDATPPSYPCQNGTITRQTSAFGILQSAVVAGTPSYLAAIPVATIIAGTTAGTVSTGEYFYITNGTGPLCATQSAQNYAFAVQLEGGQRATYVLNDSGFGGNLPVTVTQTYDAIGTFECTTPTTVSSGSKVNVCNSNPTCNGVTCA